jgi:hypothetical protein
MSTAWPQVVSWLNTTLPALFGVTGFDGPPNTGDSPVDYVTVGWTNSGETGGEFSSVESLDGLGVEEQGHVLFDVACQSANDATPAQALSEVRGRGFGYLDQLRTVMWADPTLGGILSANATVSLTNVIVQNISNQAGTAVALVVTFEYTTVTWPN